jgi:hypothetical protein
MKFSLARRVLNAELVGPDMSMMSEPEIQNRPERIMPRGLLRRRDFRA